MSVETPPATIPRLDSVQMLRGFAALLVVFSHLISIERKYSPDQLSPEWFIHGFGGVDIFFVISGFIMVYVTQNARRGLKGMGEFLFARIGRIYPLYWVVSGAFLLAWIIIPSLLSGEYDGERLLKSFALYPDIIGRSMQLPFLSVGWTLIYEMGFYLVFMFSLLLPRRKLPLFLLFWWVMFLIGYAMGAHLLQSPMQIFFQPFTAEFLMGASLGMAFCWHGARRWQWALPLSLLTLIGLALFYPVHWPSPLSRTISIGIPSALLLAGVVGLEQSGMKIARPFIALGNWSYALYLTHILTLSLLGKIWSRFAGEGLLGNAIMLTLMVSASVFVAWMTYELIEKPLIGGVKRLRRKLFT